jgi:serine/threonine-protein kinase haspin
VFRSRKNTRKLGEGAYGEVFLTHTTVCPDDSDRVAIKIIPIEGEFEVNGERQKTCEEVIPEVLIACALSTMNDNTLHDYTADNYIGVRAVSVVEGAYPAHILAAWDAWNTDDHDCQNDRPSVFDDDQLFIVFQFSDGGIDLDKYMVTGVCSRT